MWLTVLHVVLGWLVVFVLGAVGAVVVVGARSRRRLVRRRVVVVTDSGATIEGVLMSRRGGLVELRQASVSVGEAKVPADGVMFVDAKRVEWMQVVS